MTDWADLVVDRIIDDLDDRRGLKHEWRNIDEDIQEQIRERWAAIIRETFDEAWQIGNGAGT